MSAFSSTPAVLDALEAGLAAHFKASRVTVTYAGALNLGTVGDEWLNVGDVDGSQEPGGINRARKPRRETYAVELVVSVVRPPREQRAADERAFAIAGEVDAYLRENPTLDVLNVVAQPGGRFRLEHRLGGDPVRCEARLTLNVAVSASI